jgi:thiol:disulfide interchange protein
MTEPAPQPAPITPSPFKPIWFLVVVLCCLVAIVGLSKLTAPHELIHWRTDLTAARAEAEKTNKPVFLYLTANWCSACQTLRTTTWADKNVEQALRSYVPVKIDVDRQPQVALPYASDALPRFILLAPDGRSLRAIDGYLDPDAFVGWLKG